MEYGFVARRVVARTVVVALALLSTACVSVGRDFPQPEPDSLVLGQTTISETVSKYGPPQSRTKRSSNEPATGTQVNGEDLPAGLRRAAVTGDIETATYLYARAAGRGANSRLLTMSFWNDRMISWTYASNFDTDNTNFDESKLPSFVNGKTTRADIVRELGKPGGESVYPFVANQGNRSLSYQYVSTTSSRGFLSSSSETSSKIVRFLFDPSDRLITSFTQTRTTSGQARIGS